MAHGTDRMVIITAGAYQTATRIEITAEFISKSCIFLPIMLLREVKNYCLIAFLICFPALLFGQSSSYSQQIFGTRDGLVSSKIYSLAQASNRVLWIGTEFGISRCDGYTFQNYLYTTSHEPLGRILCIAEDMQHGIWLGGDKGLFYLKENNFTKTILYVSGNIAVGSLHTDPNGNVWIGDINALYKIDAQAILANHKNNKADFLPALFTAFSKRAYQITSDSQANIYIATHDGVFKIDSRSQALTTIWKNPVPENLIRSVAVRNADTLCWTDDNGEITWMIKGQISKITTPDFYNHSVFRKDEKIFSLNTSGIHQITGNSTREIIRFNSAANNTLSALIDAEGNIWAGSWEGLLKYRKKTFVQYQLENTTHKEVFSLLEKKDGSLLLGGNRGLVYQVKDSRILPAQDIPALFPQAEVLCMYEDEQNGLWAGSGYQGIARFYQGKLSGYQNTGALKDNNCEALAKTTDGNLFACTENGVTLVNPLSQQALLEHYPFASKYARQPELFGCFQNAGAVFFYGSSGLFRLKNKTLLDDSILNVETKKIYINKIVADKSGNIWVATLDKGLIKCSLTGDRLQMTRQFTTVNGLPSNTVLSVLVDKNDNVWVADYMSISIVYTATKEEPITSFNEKDGLLASYYQALKLEQQRNGTIWALTSSGMVSFHPDSVNTNHLPPEILFNNIEVNNKTISAASKNTFAYYENNFHFDFTAVCLTDAQKVHYAYRLTDIDTNWSFSNQGNITFTAIQPGTYTLEVKACNNSNEWTKEPVRFTFTIHPPWWQTWWFRMAAALLVASLLYLIYRRRIKTIKGKAAIQQQITELESKALRAQMNPHFIFNSLNAIQELIVTNKVDEGYQYLSNFSKLLRQVLNNSERNLIPLSSEIEMIKLQLSLESLRFKNAFNYSIDVDENIEPEMVNVPPLLLQPYVENAVWHGLRHKDGDKNLWIRIKETGQQLNIEIEDNGVGRRRAEEIKKNKLGAEQFESKGSLLSAQRIKLLAGEHHGAAAVNIADNKNEKGEATGTVVRIVLPSNLK